MPDYERVEAAAYEAGMSRLKSAVVRWAIMELSRRLLKERPEVPREQQEAVEQGEGPPE